MDFSAFHSNPRRALELDCRARGALADSLASIFDACREQLAWSKSIEQDLMDALRAHTVAPAVFGLYAELVEAVLADDFRTAQDRMDALLRPALRVAASPRVVTLNVDFLGSGLPDLYTRVINDDPDNAVRLAEVEACELARGQTLHMATADLLRASDPALLEEIQRLSHEVVLVQNGVGAGEVALGFEGASTFYLWGAVLLNSERLRSRPRFAQALAHEAGHAYLLGTTLGAPLVENDPSERYASPLRADPRPMDGLVHASFVLARMIWCQDRLLDSGCLDRAEREEAERARSRNHHLFETGEGLIASEARFTPEGAELWHAARDWVHAGCPI